MMPMLRSAVARKGPVIKGENLTVWSNFLSKRIRIVTRWLSPEASIMFLGSSMSRDYEFPARHRSSLA